MSATGFPGEGAAYREARDALLKAEIELKKQTEAVAALRRDIMWPLWNVLDLTPEGRGEKTYPALRYPDEPKT